MDPRRDPRWVSEGRLRAAGAVCGTVATLALLAIHPLACVQAPFVAGDGGSNADAPPVNIIIPVTDDGAADDDRAADASPCTPSGTGVLGVLGCPCPTTGVAACAGNAQKEELICQGGVWSANGRCPSGQLCDSSSGPTQGSCVPVAPACAAASPGQSVCTDEITAAQCGPDLVSTVPGTSCVNQACIAGACTGECAPRGISHNGTPGPGFHCSALTAQTCGQDGHWATALQCPVACCDDVGCTDTATDQNNCGACGHSCQGGACQGGACQPVALTLPGDPPVGIAADATNVYWTNSTSVLQMPLAGGQAVTIASGREAPIGIAVDATSIYWTDVGTASFSIGCVMHAPIGGGTPTTLASGAFTPTQIAVDATSVYWAAGGMDPYGILKASLSGLAVGGAPVPLVTGGRTPINGLAVDATSVYFTTMQCPPGASCAGVVMKVPNTGSRDAGAPVTLASGPNTTASLAVGATSVYWATTTNKCAPASDGGVICDGAVQAVGLDGGVPISLASGQTSTGDLASDGKTLYFSIGEGIASVPIDGGAVTAVASDPNITTALVQTTSTLVWGDTVCPADGGACSGSVMKVAKP